MDLESLLLTDDGLSYRRPEVPLEVVTKLRKGHWAIQHQLDLHGLRRDEAREALGGFIRLAHQNGHRCLRVVHGKGHGSPGKQPVLKAKVQRWLAQRQEVIAFAQASGPHVEKRRGGVMLRASWRDAMLLNLHSRLAQRVLVQLSYTEYRGEQDLYRAAAEVAWEIWFTPKQTIKVEVTAQHSPLNSLNFAALKIKDAVCDRFRDKAHGVRPDVNTQWPDVRIYAHLTTDSCSR